MIFPPFLHKKRGSLKNEQRVTLGKDLQQISRKITISDIVVEAEKCVHKLRGHFWLLNSVKLHIEELTLADSGFLLTVSIKVYNSWIKSG